MPTHILADGSPLPEKDIFPATKIESPETDAKVVSIINVFNLLRNGSDRKLDTHPKSDINFYFASGVGFIDSERVSKRALSPFQDGTAQEISELPTHTNTCYAQNFRFDESQKITVVIHNEDNDFQDDVFRCLVAALWWFTFETWDGFDSIDWQESFLDLF